MKDSTVNTDRFVQRLADWHSDKNIKRSVVPRLAVINWNAVARKEYPEYSFRVISVDGAVNDVCFNTWIF